VIKACPALKNLLLVRQSRLSVMPMTAAEFEAILSSAAAHAPCVRRKSRNRRGTIAGALLHDDTKSTVRKRSVRTTRETHFVPHPRSVVVTAARDEHLAASAPVTHSATLSRRWRKPAAFGAPSSTACGTRALADGAAMASVVRGECGLELRARRQSRHPRHDPRKPFAEFRCLRRSHRFGWQILARTRLGFAAITAT